MDNFIHFLYAFHSGRISPFRPKRGQDMNEPSPSTEKAGSLESGCCSRLLKLLCFFLIGLVIIISIGLSVFWVNFARVHQPLSARVLQLQQTVNAQNQQLQNLTQQSNQHDMTLTQLKQTVSDHSSQWITDEANYLLRLAHFTLFYEKNIPVALAILKEADGLLSPLSDKNSLKWREKIRRHIVALQALPTPDLSGTYLQLKALDDQVNNLKWIEDRFQSSPESASLHESLLTPSEWKQFLRSLTKSLKTLIIIRHHPEPSEPFMSNRLREIILVNLHTLFAQAEWAVLQQQSIVYKSSLSQIQQLIQNYFLPTDPRVQGLLSALADLNKINLTVSLPDLSDTVDRRDFAAPSAIKPSPVPEAVITATTQTPLSPILPLTTKRVFPSSSGQKGGSP